MLVWTAPKGMRPGGRFSRIMWLVSVPVAVSLIWFAWVVVGPGDTPGGMAFLIAWTVGLVAIEAWNFRTMYLGRGRQAEALQRANAEDGSR